MPFSINNFRAQLIGQGARPNLFEVTIPFPTSVDSGEAGQKSTFMTKGAQIPGADIGLVEVPYFGRNVKMAGTRTFAEWTTTVINDEDFAVHDAIRSWIELMNGPSSNIRLAGSTRQYQVDAEVSQFGCVQSSFNLSQGHLSLMI